jgi:SH3-like domain-containing protein
MKPMKSLIGDEGNPCWVFSCYGRKVEKAIQYRKSGLPILIIHENDFWNAIRQLEQGN